MYLSRLLNLRLQVSCSLVAPLLWLVIFSRARGRPDPGPGLGPGTASPEKKAADLGDPDSFFYLALLQSAGLHGGEAGGAGKDQARIWGLCGAHADNTNAHLLLA